ncbi:MAG TPA: TIGR03943 family protein [Anaerolineaceae bacterium]|nr:TIGR03943 family protein [Anaerolineaceae bacterium]
MDTRIYRFLQFLILTGLALFILVQYITGHLNWYINQRYISLSIIAILGFLAMAVTALLSRQKQIHSHDHEDHEEHDPEEELHSAARTPQVSSIAGIFILVIPLIIGLAIPARPLSANAVNNKGISSNAPLSAGGGNQSASVNKASADRTILDWIKIFNYQPDLSPYLGQTANVVGFVYHDAQLPAGHFMVGRFAIVCCVADAFAIGMAVETPAGVQLSDNTWVDVQGPVQSIDLDGHKTPLILASSVTTVQQPSQPYLFP